MSDTIDRQAAIEIVDRYDKSHMILKGKPMLGAASIVIELEALPSAQPHITHCAECIHWKHSAVRKSYCEVFDWMNDAEDFCSFAERRTDE